MLEEFKAPEELVDKLLDTLLIFKRSNLRTPYNTCTINGFQTPNIFRYSFTKELKEQLSKLINKDLNLFHVHLIEYIDNGEQLAHNHERTEDYSFVLYLNDSDGNTVFENIGEVKPEKGKLIFFKSNLMHYGKPSTKGKKVAVGAFKIKQ